MKKYIFVLGIFIFFLTGCTNEYTIKFNNSKIEETIVSSIPDGYVRDLTAEEISKGVEIDDPITPFIEEDQYPFDNNEDLKYDKKVSKNNSNTVVNLSYTYTHNEYRNSKAYNTCFQNHEFKENRSDYILNFSGKFYCFYGDEMTINIKTNNDVLSNNATKVSGNTYTWVVNKDNYDNINISMQISKRSAFITPLAWIVLVIVLLIIVIGGFVAYTKVKNRDSVNEI